MAFEARYYDGTRAKPYDIIVHPEADGLHLRTTEGEWVWEYASVRILEKPEYARPFILTHRDTPEARLVVTNNALYATLLKKIPRSNAPRVAISTSVISLLFWSAIALAVIAAIYWAVPPLAEPIARHLPMAWEQRLGTSTVEAMTVGKRVCSNPEGMKALEKLVATLSASADTHPQITPRVVEDKDVNAFATPGNNIVVFSGLIQTAESPEELASVLAHEMGHVIHRHPTQTLVRTAGLELLAGMVFGGTGQTASTASLANTLFQLQYSRDFERQADEEATRILYNAGISHQGFLHFFLQLEAKEKNPQGIKLVSFISNHPPTSERIEAITAAPDAKVLRPVLTPEAWQALRNICG